jgi:hypothetical protein
MKIVASIINGIIILLIGAELALIAVGRVNANQLLVSSVISGLFVITSMALLKESLFQLYGLTPAKKEVIKNEINIMDEIDSHIRWKVRLQKYLGGSSGETLDPEVICRDDRCTLGQWIHGPARNHFNDSDGYKLLRAKHAKFHAVAGEVVKKAQHNEKAAAQRMMENEYRYVSHELVMALAEFNKLIVK